MSRIISLLLAMVLLLFNGISLINCTPTFSPGSQQSSVLPSVKRPPSAPSDLSGQANSCSQITIRWIDNSDNEQGFKIYRDGSIIGSVEPNLTSFQDKNLQYGTKYTYDVAAYNETGETKCLQQLSLKTLNPSIAVTLDKIGVLFDHDPGPLGIGDIYLYIAVADSKGQPQAQRIPSTGQIKLNDNETKEIGQQIFFSDCVGDELKIVAIAFESDSGTAMAISVFNALTPYLSGNIGIATSLISILLKYRPSSTEGCPEGVNAESSEDDFVGALEKSWTVKDKWGVGSYQDVRSGDLRLWFTILIPGETTAIPQSPPSFPPPALTPTPAPAPTPTPIPTPQTKVFSVNFDGWYVDGNSVTTTSKGKTVIARVTLSGGSPGQYITRIRRAMSLSSDSTVTEQSFSYDGVSLTQQLSFSPPYATNESNTSGYHVDILRANSVVWTMNNAYPPRLRVSAPLPELPNVAIQNVDIPAEATAGVSYSYNVTLKNNESYTMNLTLKIHSSATGDLPSIPVTLAANSTQNVKVGPTTFAPPGTRTMTYTILFEGSVLDSESKSVNVR